MHLHKSSRNPHITLFSSEPAQLCNPIPLLRQTVPHPDCQLQDCWSVIGECNGLISLLSPHYDNPCPGFYLHFWNPATHSLSPKLGFFPNKYYQRDVYDPRDFDFYSEISFGFGYHNLTNQYKVVARLVFSLWVTMFGGQIFKLSLRLTLLFLLVSISMTLLIGLPSSLLSLSYIFIVVGMGILPRLCYLLEVKSN